MAAESSPSGPVTGLRPVIARPERLEGATAADLKFLVIETADEWLEVAFALFKSEFGPDVLDPKQRYVEWLDLNRRSQHPFPFLLTCAFVRRSAEAHLVGVLGGNVMPIQVYTDGSSGKEPDSYVFAIGHQVTVSALRAAGFRGFGTALWRFSLEEATSLVHRRGGRLLYSFLEAEEDSIGFWSKLGYRWPQGMRYWQPPLDFREDGSFVHAEVPETAMILPVEAGNQDAIDRALLESVIATVYQNWSLAKFRDTLTPRAMERAEGYVMGVVFERVREMLPPGDPIALVQPRAAI